MDIALFGEGASLGPLCLRRGDEEEGLAMTKAQGCIARLTADAFSEKGIVEPRKGQLAGDAEGEMTEVQAWMTGTAIGERMAMWVETTVSVADLDDDADGASTTVKTAGFRDFDGLVRGHDHRYPTGIDDA